MQNGRGRSLVGKITAGQCRRRATSLSSLCVKSCFRVSPCRSCVFQGCRRSAGCHVACQRTCLLPCQVTHQPSHPTLSNCWNIACAQSCPTCHPPFGIGVHLGVCASDSSIS